MEPQNKFLRFFFLFNRAFGAYRPHIAVLAVIGFLSGILEAVGVNALIPLFSFITGESGADDFISQAIKRLFDIAHIDFSLSYLLIFIASLFVLKAATLFIGAYIQLRITYDYQKTIRMNLFSQTLRAEWPHLIEQKIGHLEKLLSVEINFVAKLLQTTSSLVLILTSLLMFLLVAINISFPITAIAFTVGLVAIFLSHPLVSKVRQYQKRIAVKNREIAHFINENVIGMKTIKALFSGERVAVRGEAHFEALRKLAIKHSLLGGVFGILFQPFSVIFVLLLFAVSYTMGDFSLPSFVAIVYLIQRMFTQIQGLQGHIQTILSTMPYVENMLAYQSATAARQEGVGRGTPFSFKKTFFFKHVCFQYKNDKTILSGVSFEVPRGSFTGLIGPSGAGKTTIVDLALRLLQPTSGNIFLDDTPISDIDLQEYRKYIGYVSQDIHLINDTVKNNIRFFDDTITDMDITEAAKQANIYETIEKLPQKFSSTIGERGVRLSAGQRQRIVIARMLARKPKFLILDEATSALDNESEKRIQEVIENLKGKITVLVIAHRLQTVMNCDELLVLDGGRIIERGKPRELLKDKGSYFFKTHHIRDS